MMKKTDNRVVQAKWRAAAGFTLIELLLVIFIIGIGAAIAAPSITSWRQDANLSADARRLHGFLQQARVEAVKRNASCIAVRNQAVANCANAYGPILAGQPYDFVAYIDLNADGLFTDGEEFICVNLTQGVIAAPDAVWVPVQAPYNVVAPGPADTLMPVTFSGRGLPNAGGTIVLQGASGRVHSLVMNSTGRLTID